MTIPSDSNDKQAAVQLEGVASPDISSPATNRPSRGDILQPFRNRDFSLLFAGQLISVTGDMFYAVALPWYMLTTGGGPANLGLVLTAYGVPRVGTTLLGGWLSDRIRPRRVMLLSDFGRMMLMAVLAATVLRTQPALGALAALSAVLGAFDGVFFPASSAITPDILPEDALQAGNSLSFAWTQLATLLGPALAGLIVAHFDPGVAFAVDAGTFLVSALTLAWMRQRRPTGPASAAAASVDAAGNAATSSVGELAADPAEDTPQIGITQFVLRTRYFQVLLVILIAANFLNGCVGEVAIPALAHGPLHAGAQGYGFILAGLGGGALVGGLLAGVFGSRFSRGIFAVHAFVIQSGFVFALAFAFNTLSAVVIMSLWGLMNGLGNVLFLTMTQRSLPRHLLGRIMGLFAFCSFGLYPISVAIGGFAVARFGPGIVILGGACIMLVSVLSAYTVRELRDM